jgi:hypothetical protein
MNQEIFDYISDVTGFYMLSNDITGLLELIEKCKWHKCSEEMPALYHIFQK